MLIQTLCVVGHQVVPRTVQARSSSQTCPITAITKCGKGSTKAAPVAAPKTEAPISAPVDADDKLTAAERAKRMQVLQQGLAKPEDDTAAPQDVIEEAVEQTPAVEEAPVEQGAFKPT